MNLKRRLTVDEIIHNAAVSEVRDEFFEKRIRQGAAILFVLAIIWAMDSSPMLAVIGLSLAILAAFILFFLLDYSRRFSALGFPHIHAVFHTLNP